jgi:hypothetical protein
MKEEYSIVYEKTEFGSGRAAKPLYTIGSSFAFAIVYVMIRNPPPGDWIIPPIVLSGIAAFVLIAITGAAGRFFELRHKQSNQQKRDQRAQLILEQARDGRAGDYSLYLRSFSTTGQMPAEDNSVNVQPGFDPRHPDSQLVDLETVFAEVLEFDLPVVALGKPGEQIGVGRLKTDDERWKDDLEVLADNALLLFVLPSPGSSLQWEIEWVMHHNHLMKSMFVMPPRKAWFLSLPGAPKSIPWEEIWQTLRSKLDEKGIMLPPYEKEGMIFFLGADGAVSTKATLGGSLDSKWVAMKAKALLQMTAEKTRSAGTRQL